MQNYEEKGKNQEKRNKSTLDSKEHKPWIEGRQCEGREFQSLKELPLKDS